jgi:integrase
MSIRWDTRNKRWRFEFDRYVQGHRHRLSRLLPKGWSRAQADAYDGKETARLYAVATGVTRAEPLIDTAVELYLRDKEHLKSHAQATEHLAAIAWAYIGKPVTALPDVARLVVDTAETAAATVRNRLALLKAAARWAWKKHGLTEHDPSARMQLPSVRNERHNYYARAQMLAACRRCTNWQAQIAIRVSFYTGMRLSELLRVRVDRGLLLLEDTKNGDVRAIPIHHKIAHLVHMLPLQAKRHTIQVAWMRARDRAGVSGTFHDLRHSAASEMVNAGVPLFEVGAVLGHRDTRSTKRYSHLTAARLQQAVNTIGRKPKAAA